MCVCVCVCVYLLTTLYISVKNAPMNDFVLLVSGIQKIHFLATTYLPSSIIFTSTVGNIVDVATVNSKATRQLLESLTTKLDQRETDLPEEHFDMSYGEELAHKVQQQDICIMVP